MLWYYYDYAIKTNFEYLIVEPSAPTRLSISSNSSSEVAISWYPPESPNGELETFEIYIRSVPEDVAFQDTRNYCKDGRTLP